tara:strand:+ start:209 stop:424 length:216 start_codon:yes stop_codon:yes gene_type:complete
MKAKEKKELKMINFIYKEFDKISKNKNGFISLLDIWDTEFKLEKKFNVRSKTSQKISSLAMKIKKNKNKLN